MSVIEGQVLWTPSEETRAAAQLTQFTDWLEAKAGLQFAGYRELHAWSVEQPQEFWSAVWHFFDICSDTPYEAVVCTENLIRVDDVMESPKLAE